MGVVDGAAHTQKDDVGSNGTHLSNINHDPLHAELASYRCQSCPASQCANTPPAGLIPRVRSVLPTLLYAAALFAHMQISVSLWRQSRLLLHALPLALSQYSINLHV